MNYYNLISKLKLNREQIGCLNDSVLVWSEHYETAVFRLFDDIHEETRHVWYQLDADKKYGEGTACQNEILILKVSGRLVGHNADGKHYYWYGELVQKGLGNVPYKNEVVFTKYPKCLHVASAAGNTAEAVFPQNIRTCEETYRLTSKEVYTKRVMIELFDSLSTEDRDALLNHAITIKHGKAKLI